MSSKNEWFVHSTDKLLLDEQKFRSQIIKMVIDKLGRTIKNDAKKPFSDEDMKNNLITGFSSGYYMYFRDVYNDINLGRIQSPSDQYKAANFYFIREYCYGSMFRYNAKGEFNIPYGGISYNTKNLKSKIDNMFNHDIETVFRTTDIYSMDFEKFIASQNLSEDDFMFLDPPYDIISINHLYIKPLRKHHAKFTQFSMACFILGTQQKLLMKTIQTYVP